jgi:phosphatidylethanolamine-binding protein (PEBP) family uncharacterized protein
VFSHFVQTSSPIAKITSIARRIRDDMRPIVEVAVSWLLKNAKGRDAKCFFTRPAFAKHAEQTIEITSPDCGPTNAQLGVDYTADGSGRCPALTWTAPPAIADRVKEWLLVSEDPDAPLPTPIAHGCVTSRPGLHAIAMLTIRRVFGGIPPSKTSVEAKDFEIEDETKALLKGGFHYGVTRRNVPYIPPRPLMNHGPHRCKSFH